MIKTFALIKRKPNLTKEEFFSYWRNQHAPLAAKAIPGLRKYIQHYPVNVLGIEFEYDGIAEIWWDDIQTLEKYFLWRKTPEARILISDEEKFIDVAKTVRFFAEDYVVVEH